MTFDIESAAGYAGQELDRLLDRAERTTVEILEKSDISAAVAWFAEFRDTVKSLAAKVADLQKHVDRLSYNYLPAMFENAGVKTITVTGVGRATVNARWTCSMVDKARGMDWLKSTGNGGLVIETVNANTLGAFAKEETLAGRPLPGEIFKTSAAPLISITRT